MGLCRLQKRRLDPSILLLSIRVVWAVCVLLLAIASSANAQNYRKVPVPQEIVHRLSKIEYVKECSDERGGAEKILQGESLRLSKGGSEILVSGKSCLCGATGSCPGWIYRKTTKGYQMIMDVSYLQSLEYRKGFTNGYRDVKISDRIIFGDNSLNLYKFDGKKYQLKECFERRNAGGGITGKMEPKTVRVKCHQVL